MNKSRWLILSGFLLVFCILVGGAAFVGIIVPSRVEQRFGPPANSIGAIQRIQLAWDVFTGATDLTTQVGTSSLPIKFEIGFGESTASVIFRLTEQGFLRNPTAFRSYLVYSGIDTQLQAGTYELTGQMTPLDIAATLQNPAPEDITFVVLPGWRVEEIAAALPTSGLSISPEAFLQAAKAHPRQYLFELELPDRATLEGFLLPGSYTFPRDTPLPTFLATLLLSTQTAIEDNILDGFAQQGLTLYQGVILASIVQREAIVAAEQPQIASVFFNRLDAQMPLQTDPTVQYALGYDDSWGWWKSPLQLSDLQVQSPYNTYLNAGLPPGPIANPSETALRAVAYPARTPYYFFRATCDGSGLHNFAQTYAEHQANACP
jgi:UPF0755 protein